MGQKTNPIGFRLGYIKTWKSRWYSKENYSTYLHEDLSMRRHIKSSLENAAISSVEIERRGENVTVFIHTARPGIIIGRRGAEVNKLREELNKLSKGKVNIEIKEIKNAELDAQLVAESIANQIERRIGFRRAMKRAVANCMRFGALGVKIEAAGRLGGAEMARSERYFEGRVPLHTLRADIDYGVATAKTNSGAVGIKVWIFLAERLPGEVREEMMEVERRPPRKAKKKPKRTPRADGQVPRRKRRKKKPSAEAKPAPKAEKEEKKPAEEKVEVKEAEAKKPKVEKAVEKKPEEEKKPREKAKAKETEKEEEKVKKPKVSKKKATAKKKTEESSETTAESTTTKKKTAGKEDKQEKKETEKEAEK